MSMGNADVIQNLYAAAARGDGETMVAALAPDVAWTEMAGFPYAGTYHGPDEVVQNVLARIEEEWEDFRINADELLEAGDRVVMVGSYDATYRATGKRMQARVVHVWRVQDGKIAEFEQFTDTLKVAEALEA
jgi:ketosteroid isomerase-like protein